MFRRVAASAARGKKVRGKRPRNCCTVLPPDRLSDWTGDEVRCRIVATQSAKEVCYDTLAGTPPPKFVRLRVSLAATLTDARGRHSFLIGLCDASHACDPTDMDEEVHAVPLKGEEEPGVYWQLLKAMYGTRRASELFQKLIIDTLISQGCLRIKVTTNAIWHNELWLYITVHGDDFEGIGAYESLMILNGWLEADSEIKRAPFIGPPQFGDEINRSGNLKGTSTWSEEGFSGSAEPKHALAAVEAYVKEAASRSISPSSKHVGKSIATPLDELPPERAKLFRSAAPTCLYLSDDRPEIQQAVPHIMRGQQGPKVDSDLAGDEITRRTRGGGFEFLGVLTLDGWPGQQQARAMSSGEAEYSELCRGGARGLLTKNLMNEMQIDLQTKALGSSRHLELVSKLPLRVPQKGKAASVQFAASMLISLVSLRQSFSASAEDTW